MSIPECPPCNPLIAILKAVVFSGVVSSVYLLVAVTSIPPAHPMSISSSSSVSRFKRISPVKIPPSKPIAPVIPVSSSMVNKASIAGCLISSEDSIAIIVATPKPLSAPNVVPSAVTQSPFICILIPSVSKLKTVSEFF